MIIQVNASRQVKDYLNSSSEECRSAFREFEELLKKHIPSVPGEFIFAGFSGFPLRTGELIVLKRQIKKGWMGDVYLINIFLIVSAEKFENLLFNLLFREMGNSQDTSGLNLENQNPLNQIVIGSLDQAGRFDILLKVIPIIAGLLITGLIAITESQGLTNILPNKQNPPPSQLEKPPQPD